MDDELHLKREMEAEDEILAKESDCGHKDCKYYSEAYNGCMLPDKCIFEMEDD